LLTILGFGILALFISTLAGGVWAGLMLANTRTTPSIPWAFLAMAALLWLAWRYLGGKGWPQSTSQTRRQLLRANPVSTPVFFWTICTGALAITALAGLWIVMFQLFKMPPNALSDYSRYPLFTIATFIVMGSLVSPLMEEAGYRGYLQVALEREFIVPVAILVSSLFFALAHLNHGALVPKLLIYFLVGVTFGVMTWLTNSILPVIPVHIIGDLTFFILVWPHDKARRLVSDIGADRWFWLHLAQAIVFAILAILAMRQLARVSRTSSSSETLASQSKTAG
jgi:membrane protease YdiL (CAAX protease family)